MPAGLGTSRLQPLVAILVTDLRRNTLRPEFRSDDRRKVAQPYSDRRLSGILTSISKESPFTMAELTLQNVCTRHKLFRTLA
jgi:hypothetical protein